MGNKKQLTFEEKLAELEKTVRQMEAGEMTLDQTLTLYEQGMKLSGELSGELAAAEKRMLELSGGMVREMEDAP